MDVRRGDTVLVLAGKDPGKRGTVERIEKTKRGLGVVDPRPELAQAPYAGSEANPAGRDHRPAGADSHQQRAGRLSALQPADPDSARALEGGRAQRPGMQALRRADRGDDEVSPDEKTTTRRRAGARAKATADRAAGREAATANASG